MSLGPIKFPNGPFGRVPSPPPAGQPFPPPGHPSPQDGGQQVTTRSMAGNSRSMAALLTAHGYRCRSTETRGRRWRRRHGCASSTKGRLPH